MLIIKNLIDPRPSLRIWERHTLENTNKFIKKRTVTPGLSHPNPPEIT